MSESGSILMAIDTTLEANYFDKMLHHASSYEYNQSRANHTENDTPF